MADQADQDCTAEMEEFLEKIKLLNYEKDFVKAKGAKHINRAYFAIQLNQTEQFNTFKQIIEWLFKLNDVKGVDFFSDPNTVAQSILFEMKNLGFEYSFPPLKLAKGSGFYVVQLLLDLANRAIQRRFKFKQPRQEKAKEAVQDGGGDIGGDDQNDMGMKEDMSIASDDDIEDGIGNDFANANQEIDEDKAIIDSKIDIKQWIIECQRVGPKLTINPKSDSKEWRSHIEQTKQYQENIKQKLPDSRQRLEKVSEQLGKVLDQISKREKNINQNMTDLGGEYKIKSEKVKQINVVYTNLNTGVKEMGEQYRQLTEKYEMLEQKIKDHGDNVTDSSPVIKVKQSLTNMRNEIKQMDLRIGVLNHTILQHKLRAKKHYDIDGVEIEQIQAADKQDHIDDLDEF